MTSSWSLIKSLKRVLNNSTTWHKTKQIARQRKKPKKKNPLNSLKQSMFYMLRNTAPVTILVKTSDPKYTFYTDTDFFTYSERTLPLSHINLTSTGLLQKRSTFDKIGTFGNFCPISRWSNPSALTAHSFITSYRSWSKWRKRICPIRVHVYFHYMWPAPTKRHNPNRGNKLVTSPKSRNGDIFGDISFKGQTCMKGNYNKNATPLLFWTLNWHGL